MATTTYSIIPDEMTPEEYYQKARQEQIAASEANTQANLATLSGQTETANQTYDKIAKEAYANLLNSERQSANTLAGAGLYNSGYADTNKIMLQNQYGTTIADNAQNRANALRDIETRRQQYILQGQSDIAQINANFDNAYAQFLYQKQQDELAAKTAAEQRALSNAYNAAEYGDFTKLQALGIDTTAAKKLWDAKVYSQLASAYGSGSGSGKANNTSNADPIQVEKGKQEAAAVIRIYSKQGYSANDILNMLNRQQSTYTNLYGSDFWDSYKSYLLSNYPGMSGYTAAEDTTGLNSLQSVSQFISDNVNQYYDATTKAPNTKALGLLLLNSTMPDSDLDRAFVIYTGMTADEFSNKYLKTTTSGGHYTK